MYTRTAGHLASRILIAELDSMAQAERYATDPELATAQLSGMLRTGRLISEAVLVTDVMLLDGTYFMTLGPEGVLRELGARDSEFPLVLTGTSDSLTSALKERVDNPDFPWSLEAVTTGNQAPQWVRDRWQEWISFEQRGLIHYVTQSGEFELPTDTARPAVDSPHRELFTALENEKTRRKAIKLINEGSLNAADQKNVFRWWNDLYLRAIAKRADADWLSFEAPETQPLDTGHNDDSLHLPQKLLTWAHESNPASMGLAMDATADQREHLRGSYSIFEERRRWGAVRSLAYQATQVSSIPTRGQVLRSAWAKVIAAIAAFILGALEYMGLSTSRQSTALSFSSSLPSCFSVHFHSTRSAISYLCSEETREQS
ncbi:MAG: hypothetical protein ACTHW1_08725 [Ancrocorticia sp.]|uniref:hypothetical protein n=1 Tax=Ancrocorticia sp. TaxID=2593684 RepID=UPI003F8F6249